MIRRILTGILLLLVILCGAFYLYLRSSLPQVEGRIAVSGLKADVTVARDGDGVPLITAADDEDAAFGLGFAHAQDRLFQMELMRRNGAGRLAELFGAQAIDTDRQVRVLGLYRLAEAELLLLSEPVRRGIEAYVAGVNALPAHSRMKILRSSTRNTPMTRRRPWQRWRRSIASSRSTASTRRCRRRSARSTPRTTGSSTARTVRAASPSSPTTRISPLARRGSGTWPG